MERRQEDSLGHLVGLRELSAATIVRILGRAVTFRRRVSGGEPVLPLMPGRSVALSLEPVGRAVLL